MFHSPCSVDSDGGEGFFARAMAGVKMVVALLFFVYVSWVGVGVGAQSHHVVGGDRGWAKASEVTEWLSDKVFRVGDKICKSCDYSFYMQILSYKTCLAGKTSVWLARKGKRKVRFGNYRERKKLGLPFPLSQVISRL